MHTVNHDSEPTHRCGAASASKCHILPGHYHHLRRPEVAQCSRGQISIVTNHHGVGRSQVARLATPAEVDRSVVDLSDNGGHVRSQQGDSDIAEGTTLGKVLGQGVLKGYYPIGIHLGKR